MSVARHTVYNVLGAIVPIAVALATIPLYIEIVGLARYGTLTLCWLILGYIGFFDLGLGLAVSHDVARSTELPNASRETADAQTLWTAMWLSLAASMAGVLLLYILQGLYFNQVFSGSPGLRTEIEDAVLPLLCLVPILLISSVFAGALQGRREFLTLNISSVASSTLMSVLPLILASVHQPILSTLILGAVAARAVGLIILAAACARRFDLLPMRWITPPRARGMLNYGWWVSLSGLLAPLVLTLDRTVIGAISGPSAVAIYSIPAGLVSRMALLSTSLSSALFPDFSSREPAERVRLATRAVSAAAVLLTPLSVLIICFLEPLLSIWISPEVAKQSAPIGYALTFGVWVGSFSHLALTLLQASGRPDIETKLRFFEIVPFIGLLVICMRLYGTVGAAIAFSIRAALEFLVLCGLSGLGTKQIWFLLPPGAIILAAGIYATWADAADMRFLVLALGSAAAWSLLRMPPELKKLLSRRAISRLSEAG